jgi:hypothetical protein
MNSSTIAAFVDLVVASQGMQILQIVNYLLLPKLH